jgi:prepilin-type processing-associated H-X9-DG protein
MTRLRDVADGLSNTVLLVEQGGFPLLYEPRQVIGNHFTTEGPWISKDSSSFSFRQRINETNDDVIFSLHSGGAYVAMADGSVHFLREGVDPAVIHALMTREGGEAISDKDLRR